MPLETKRPSWFSGLRIGAPVILLLALVAPFSRANASTDAKTKTFLPGHEAAVLALIRPHDAESLLLGGWRLLGVDLGPDCAIRFRFEAAKSQHKMRAVLTPRESPRAVGTSGIAVAFEPGDGLPRAELLQREFVTMLAGNDPGDFFRDKCSQTSEFAASSGQVLVTPFVWLLLALIVAAMMLYMRRAAPGERRFEPTLQDGSWKYERLFAGLLVGSAVAVRVPRILQTVPRSPVELENYYGFWNLSNVATGLDLLWSIIGLSGTGPQRSFHSPLGPVLLDAWNAVGALFGVGGEVVWLRLPNLLLTVLLLLVALRIGRLLGHSAAGWTTALLLAFLPQVIEASTFQEHYFQEMVVTAIFWERLTTYLIERRPVFLSLALAAVLCVWTGPLTALVLLPGLVYFLVAAWCRRQSLMALLALMFALLLYAPLLPAHMLGALDYGSLSITQAISADESSRIQDMYSHPPLAVEVSFLMFPLDTAKKLGGTLFSWIFVLGLVLLWVRYRKIALLCTAVVLAFAFMSITIATTWPNLYALFPLFLMIPALGFAAATSWHRRRYVGVAVNGVFVVTSMVSGMLAAVEKMPESVDLKTGALLAEQRYRDIPLVLTSHLATGDLDESQFLYLLCPDRSSQRATHNCLRSRHSAEQQSGFRLFDVAGRRVAIPLDDLDSSSLLEETEALLLTSPWSGGRFLRWSFLRPSDRAPRSQPFPGCRTVLYAESYVIEECT